jgi:hypothetical protein
MGNKGPRKQVVATVSQGVWGSHDVSIDWSEWEKEKREKGKKGFGKSIEAETRKKVEGVVRAYRANRKHAGNALTLSEWKQLPDDDPRRERGVETVEDVREFDAFAGAVQMIRAWFKKAGLDVELSTFWDPDDPDSVRPFEQFIGEELTGDGEGLTGGGTGPSERKRIYDALQGHSIRPKSLKKAKEVASLERRGASRLT